MLQINQLRQALGLIAQLDNLVEDAKMHVEDLTRIDSLVEELETAVTAELSERERAALRDAGSEPGRIHCCHHSL